MPMGNRRRVRVKQVRCEHRQASHVLLARGYCNECSNAKIREDGKGKGADVEAVFNC